MDKTIRVAVAKMLNNKALTTKQKQYKLFRRSIISIMSQKMYLRQLKGLLITGMRLLKPTIP